MMGPPGLPEIVIIGLIGLIVFVIPAVLVVSLIKWIEEPAAQTVSGLRTPDLPERRHLPELWSACLDRSPSTGHTSGAISSPLMFDGQ